VKKGDVIADGPNTEQANSPRPQRARRVMPWNGYNFEDAITISEKV